MIEEPKSVVPAGTLRRVEVRLALAAERERWDRTMREAHYLRSVGLIGKSLRYVAQLDGEWVALIGWCSGAFKCGPRDRWIGWPEMVQWQRLRLVVNNARFLILPGVRIANLASRVLGLTVRRLSSDWNDIHGHPVLLAETFVDPERYTGTCYRAAGWETLGLTRGFARDSGGWVEHGKPKLLLVRPLVKRAVEQLRDPASGVKEGTRVSKLKLDGRRTGNLIGVLLRIPDPRGRQGRQYPLVCVLGIAICATLAGARGWKAMAEFASRLNERQRKRLACPKNPKTQGRPVPGERVFRVLLSMIDPEVIDKALEPWLATLYRGQKGLQAIAIDGKTLRAAQANGEKIHLLAAVVHGTRVALAQRSVGAKANEITEAPALLSRLDLNGKVVTADAMHTQTAFAKWLVDEKKADYIFVVKDNQPTLKKDIEDLFSTGSFPPSG